MHTKAGSTQAFRKEWAERKKEVASERNEQPKAPRTERSPSFSSEACEPISQQPWPAGAISLEFASSVCPAPVRIYEDHSNGRWQVFFPGIASRSRSWAAHSHAEAARQVLEWAWCEVLELQGWPKSACPIVGLIRAPGAGASAPAAASEQPARSDEAPRPSAEGAASSSSAPPPAKRSKR